MKRKFLALLLAVCMVVSLVPVGAFAANGDAVAAEVEAANLHDTRLDNDETKADAIADEDLVKDFVVAVADVSNGNAVTGVDKIITMTGTDLQAHQNAANPEAIGYWVGVAFIAPEGAAKYKVASSSTANNESLPQAFLDRFTNAEATETVDVKEGKKGYAQYFDLTDIPEANHVYVKIQWLDNDGKALQDSESNEIGAVVYEIKRNVTMVTPITVTFDPNGGEFAEGTETTAEVDENGKVTFTAEPTKTGFTFTGWFEGTETEGEVTIAPDAEAVDLETKTFDADTILYAGWEEDTAEDKIVVTFNPNGGVFAEGVENTVEADENGKVTFTAEPTKDGFTFTGWFEGTETEGEVTIAPDAEAVDLETKTFDADTILYAGWEEITYTLTATTNDETLGTVTATVPAETEGDDPVDATTVELKAGDTVTITATPEEGNKVGSIKINGTPVDATDTDGVATYEYTVSADDADADGVIAVEAFFVDAEAVAHNITIAEDLENVTITASAETAYEGDTITLTVTETAGYELSDLTITSGENNDEVLFEGSKGTYTFTMPNADVNVSATVAEFKPTVTFSSNEGGELTAKVGADESAADIESGNKVGYNNSVTFTVAPDAGYELKSLKVNDAAVDVVTDPETGAITYTTLVTEDTTVVAEFGKISYTFTATAENGTITATVGGVEVDGEVEYGSDVEITVTPEAGYEFASLTVNGEAVEDLTADDAGVVTYTIANVTANTTVVAAFTAIEYNVTIAENITGGTVESDATDGKSTVGQNITLTITPEDGFSLVSLTVTDAEGNEIETTKGEGSYTFEMPASDVTVIATFAKISVEVTKDVTVPEDLVIPEGAVVADAEALATALENSAMEEVAPDSPAIAEIVKKTMEEAAANPDVAEDAEIVVEIVMNIEATEVTDKSIKVDIKPVFTATVKGEADPFHTEEINSFAEPVTITIGLPDGFEPKTVIHHGDQIERLPVVFDGTAKTATFQASSFSEYELVNEATTLTITYVDAEGNETSGSFTLGTLNSESKLAASATGWALEAGEPGVYEGEQLVDVRLFNELYLISTDGALTLYEGRALATDKTVSFDTAANGTFTVEVGGEAIESGDTVTEGTEVTVTATPNSDYKVSKIVVKAIISETETVVHAQGTTSPLTFEMPDKNVVVEVTFEKKSTGGNGGGSQGGGNGGGGNGGGSETPSTSHSVKVPATVENGKISVSPTSAKKGTTVTITVTPDEGYELDKLTVTDADGKTITTTGSEGKYTFTMPDSAVNVSATFKKTGTTPWQNPFKDVGDKAWYFNAVKYVNENGLMVGDDKGNFNPSKNLTRAEFAQILFSKEGKPAVTGESKFPDVVATAWYANAINWATQKGILAGYSNGKVGPNDNITREQLASLLWRYEGSPAPSGAALNFKDAGKISGWAKTAMQWAVENGVMKGTDTGMLNPTAPASRADAAQMLMNYFNK